MRRLPSVHHRFGIKPESLAAKAICDGVPDKGLALLKKEIEKGNSASQLTISDACVDTFPRSATLGQLLLSQGSVGDFHVWCAAICMKTPNC